MFLDFYAYNRTLDTKFILHKHQNVFVVVLAKSALDIQNMNQNEFLSMYRTFSMQIRPKNAREDQ